MPGVEEHADLPGEVADARSGRRCCGTRAGRNWFSRRNVQPCTSARRACASRDRPRSGVPSVPSASRGIITSLHRPDAVGVPGDLRASPSRGHQVGVRARVAGGDRGRTARPSSRPAGRARRRSSRSSCAQVAGLEALDDRPATRRPSRPFAVELARAAAPRARGRSSRSTSGAWSPGRRRPAGRRRSRECRARSSTSSSVGTWYSPSNAVFAGRTAGSRSLARRVLQLGEREVLGEPAGDGSPVDGLGRPAVGELGVVGDVGRAADLVLVAGDEHAVLRRDEVGLDEVGALQDRRLVGRRACARGGSRWRRGAPTTVDVARLRRRGTRRRSMMIISVSSGVPGDARGVARVVVVVGDQQPAVAQLHDRLERLHRRRRTGRRCRSRRRRRCGRGLAILQQVEHQRLARRSRRRRCRSRSTSVDALDHRRRRPRSRRAR